MRCTLLVPDLLLASPSDAGPPPASVSDAGPQLASVSDAGLYRDLRLPALTRLLARGRLVASDVLGMEAWLCQQFEVERQHDWPVAPLTLMIDGGDAGNAYWLRCDPAHLRADRSQLLLAAGAAIAPTQYEAAALTDALNSHFAQDGLLFSSPHPERWYLRLADTPALATYALPDITGKNINRYLPQGGDSLRWHQRLNEIQMLLHAHPVNAAREARNQPPINTVWPWGGGVKPVVRSGHFSRVWSDDALALALAATSSIPSHSLPPAATPLLDARAGGMEDQLAVLPQLRSAAADADFERWRAGLLALENEWFSQLHDALLRRQLSSLTIIALSARRALRCDISAGDVWKFWRPLRPLAQYG